MLVNKKVIITNDDSISSEGLLLLVKEIAKYTKDILIIAPKFEASAVSHKLTIRSGIKVEKVASLYLNFPTYTVDGTPADCVKFAIVGLKYSADYVISGINNGLNLGDDILYSGTVAAAFEAGLNKIKAIAFSTDRGKLFLAPCVKDVIEYISHNDYLLNRAILNVNIPENNKGIKITRQGLNPFDSRYVLEDGLYYSVGTALGKNINQDKNSDVLAYHEGYISITPLTVDRTDYS